MPINNKLLALFEGKCWHEPEEPNEAMSSCKHCHVEMLHWPNPVGWKPRDEDEHEPNPSYATSPADRERLLQYLMGQGEMWAEFECWIEYGKYQPETYYMTTWQLFAWIMLPPPDTTIPRWLLLLQEWLGLDETRERFGMIRCPNCDGYGVLEGFGEPEFYCKECNQTGKAKAEWTK